MPVDAAAMATMTAEQLLELRRLYLFRPCETKEELRQWLIGFLGLDFPDCIVDEDSNSCPMDMVWEVYSKMRANNDPEFARVLYFACRDGFKTLGAAAIEVLSILHLGRSVAHMAAIKEQAIKAQSYVKSAFRRPHLRDFVVSDNETKTVIRRYYNPRTKHNLTVDEYAALSESAKAEHQEVVQTLTEYRDREEYIKVVICTMQGANSEHVPLMIIDEVDVVVSKAAYDEAQNIPSARAGKLALTILTSTRKFAFGLVQEEINNQAKSGLHVRHWNLIDIAQPCPASRHKCGVEHEPGHCPAERSVKIYRSATTLMALDEATYEETLTPKEKENYVEDRGYQGCLDSCSLFAVCKTRLATHQHSKSTFLNSIDEVRRKFRNQRTIEMAQAQLMCWKPATTGLIYPRFDRSKHVLTPAQAYFRITGEEPPQGKRMTKAELIAFVRERGAEWFGGMDFGNKHNFVYTQGFKDGARMFLTNVFSASGLGTDEQVANCEQYLVDEPRIYPDMADLQAIRIFYKSGFNMVKWKKAPKSVMAGITAVEAKLSPVHSREPELFFVVDADEDSMMGLMIQRVQEYHWKVGADGKPIYGTPQEEDDDEVDALRYLVMNVFPMKGVGVTVGVTATTDAGAAERSQPAAPSVSGYDPNNWVRQKVAEMTGGLVPPSRPRMTIEAPVGSGLSSYYADEETGEVKKVAPRARKGPGPNAGTTDQPVPEGAGRKGRLVWNLG